MHSPRILVVEDDAAIRRGLVDALSFAGYGVMEAARGDEGIELATTARYDLLLLDLVLPGTDGFTILRTVRETDTRVPIILLTARGDESDRVKGLRAGADDYVVKPFSVRELTARVEAVLRRTPDRPVEVQRLNLPMGEVDFDRREIVHTDGRRTDLSEKESEILQYLAAHAGRVISREELLARVWRLDPRGLTTRAVDMQIARLREKLGDGSDPQTVRTVRGRGYVLATDSLPAENSRPAENF